MNESFNIPYFMMAMNPIIFQKKTFKIKFKQKLKSKFNYLIQYYILLIDASWLAVASISSQTT